MAEDPRRYRRGAQKPSRAGSANLPPPIDENNIEEAEKRAMERVNKSLSVLEVAIASWEASKDKPKHLEEKFNRYKKLHDVLSQWERKMLKAIGKREDFGTRLQRLQEFADICLNYT